MSKRKTHTFTITVTAPAAFTKAEIKREIRTNIRDHAAYLNGKYGPNDEWVELKADAIKVKAMG